LNKNEQLNPYFYVLIKKNSLTITKLKHISFFVCFLLVSFFSFGNLPGPKINCVSVLPNGNITITWESVLDPTGIFVNYEIFEVTSGGMASLQVISNRLITSFTHTTTLGQTSSFRYVVSTNSSVPSTNFSDTVSSIKLFVNNPSNGMAILNWNPVFSPINSPTASNWYRIFREYPLGTWTLIDSVPYGNEYYRDTITICNDSINYRVTNSNTYCASVSSVDGKTFSDVIPPYPPTIRSVTVDTSLNVGTIRWNPSRPNDTRGYIILKNIGGSWVPIDTVYGINNTSYVYSLSNAGNESECFGVAAFDSCYYGTPLTPNTSAMSNPHCSVYVQQAYRACDKTITFNWNSYSGWSSGVLTYHILESINGSQPTTKGSTSGNSFTLNNVKADSTYCVVIQAISQNLSDSSLSNKICTNTIYPYISDTNYLQTVTVDDENKIDLKIFTTPSNTIKGYTIYKSTDNGSTFNEIGFAPNSSSPILFSDRNVNTSVRNYAYKGIAKDSCNNGTNQETNTSQTILLEANINQSNYKVTISWTPYSSWDGNIREYNIYRKTGNGTAFLLATLPSTVTTFEDDLSRFYNASSDGNFCYYVEAVENINSYLISEISLSNETCVSPKELIYIPNAFTPNSDGTNDYFLPIIGFADYTTYSLRIFNRLGQEVFTTTDINTGWDGFHDGETVTNEIFLYTVLIETAEGKPISKSGTVLVVR
jgi:gliding motility-associated-like protein